MLARKTLGTNAMFFFIYEQLCFGVRFLDLRLTTKHGVVWTCHNFACVPLTVCLADIARFVQKNPSEIVLIYAVQAWRKPMDWPTCQKAFAHVLGPSLISYSNAMNCNIGDLTTELGQHIILISDPLSQHLKEAWSTSTLSYYWPQVASPAELDVKLHAIVKEANKRTNGFFWVKAEATPDRAMVLHHLFSSSVQDLAELCHPFILDMLRQEPLTNSFNVISTDFIHDYIIAAIIDLNDECHSSHV